MLQRKSAAALRTSISDVSASMIFPAFELFLYLLVFVNMFTGLLILVTDYHAEGEWTISNFLFTAAVTMQHMVCEGIAFMLIQKGCGVYAFKTAAYYAFIWGAVTYLFLVYSLFRLDGSYEIFSIWNALLLLFYLSVWFAPIDRLYRRPAAILFAKLFTVYHGATFIFFTIAHSFDFISVPCAFFFNFVFLEPFLQPIFAYYILLQDCRYVNQWFLVFIF